MREGQSFEVAAEELSVVAVSKAGGHKLAAGDGLEKPQVTRFADVKRPESRPASMTGFATESNRREQGVVSSTTAASGRHLRQPQDGPPLGAVSLEDADFTYRLAPVLNRHTFHQFLLPLTSKCVDTTGRPLDAVL